MSFARRALLALGLLFVGTVAACSENAEEEEAPRDGVVAASETTKNELGVVEWHMTPGGTHDFFSVTGVDARGGAVADVAISVQRFSERVGTFTYDIHGAESAHLYFNYNGDHVETNIHDLATAPRAHALLTRIQADLDAPTPSTLTSQSLKLQGGHAGGPLVRNAHLVDRGTCLLDRSGQGCAGALIQTTAGLIAVPLCVATAPVTLGAQMALCVLGGIQTVGTIVAMGEAGCQQRPCSERAKSR